MLSDTSAPDQVVAAPVTVKLAILARLSPGALPCTKAALDFA
jgi:hypothetical protein